MKNIKVLLGRVFLTAGVVLFHLPAFSAYSQGDSFDELGAGPEKGARASKVILSYKGEPVCVSSLMDDPSLAPDFLNPAPSVSYEGETALPDCNAEERDIIYQSAGNAAPVNAKGGVDVAGAPVGLFVCVVGAVGGAGAKIMGEMSADAEEEAVAKLVAPSLAAMGGAPIALTLGGNSSAAAAAGGAGSAALSETAAFALNGLSYLKSFLGTGAIMATCGAAAYYGLSYIMD